VTDDRRAELAANLAEVSARIAKACQAAGRDPGEVTLVAVTKTHPASDVALLAELGVRDIGENRDQEAAPKARELLGHDVRWHFIGQLQRNKCRSVARYASVVESVDSVRLAAALDRAAQAALQAGERAQPIDVLVQVSLDGDAARGGALPHDPDPDTGLDAVLAAVSGADVLRLKGLMAVAPLDRPAAEAFQTLAAIATEVRVNYPTANILSAGMSDDLEDAVASGATQVRVGSSLLGRRLYLR
jgi:pyridoxal phosphate enzyme (YggS family)